MGTRKRDYGTLLLLCCIYATVLPVIVMLCDLFITGAGRAILDGSFTFYNLFEFRKLLYFKSAGTGVALGFVLWFFWYRKVTHYDPLDRYFK